MIIKNLVKLTKNFAISLKKLFLNNVTKIIKLVDELIDRVWLMIYNKKREKNKIINISVDKDKDIEGYVNIYNKIVADKLEFE